MNSHTFGERLETEASSVRDVASSNSKRWDHSTPKSCMQHFFRTCRSISERILDLSFIMPSARKASKPTRSVTPAVSTNWIALQQVSHFSITLLLSMPTALSGFSSENGPQQCSGTKDCSYPTEA